MVLLTVDEFIPKFKALFHHEIKGGSGAVTVQTKSIPSVKIGKLLREEAIQAGPNVWLIRAFKNGNNKHKIKISTAVTGNQHSEFQLKLAGIMKSKMHGLGPTKKNKRHAKATQ